MHDQIQNTEARLIPLDTVDCRYTDLGILGVKKPVVNATELHMK